MEKRQYSKVGVSGGFFNQLMGNNSTEPVVGQWYTVMLYTDRHVGKVKEIRDNGEVVLESYKQDVENGKVSYSPDGCTKVIKWYPKSGQWKQVWKEVHYKSRFVATVPSPCISLWLKNNDPELYTRICGENGRLNLVPGYTKRVQCSSPIKIIFGVCDYYYDPSF